MTIFFFAQAREAAARSSVVWETTTPQSVPELWKWLLKHFPNLAPLKEISRIARNEEYLQNPDNEELLQSGDTVAIIPPVSGG